jgi:hypothetical protein
MTTGESKEVQSKLIQLLKPDEDLTINVRTVKYTRGELEEFIEQMLEPGMIPESGNHQIGSVYISTEGTIVVELVNIKPTNAKAFLESIPETIPQDVLVLRQGGCAQACSLLEEHRPVIGGIVFTERTGLFTEYPSTIGFIGEDEDEEWGYLTAGHSVQTGFWDGNHQPAWDNLIGQTKVCDHDIYADAGWVVFENGISYAKELHPEYSNTQFLVKYRYDFDDLYTGQNVRFIGKVTGFVSTEISGFTAITYDGQQTNYAIMLDDECDQGDSGGPIYTRSYVGNQVYHVTAVGIIVANAVSSPHYAYGCAIDRCESAMGLTIDITD